ncbi:MAG: hypothetical protein KDA86_27100 [Planctomycetaceae bacterium]|nr:hypothetical protein [Planctomycetaceae bacterium]
MKSRGIITGETYDSIAYPLLVVEMKTGFFSRNPVGKAYNDYYIVWFGK